MRIHGLTNEARCESRRVALQKKKLRYEVVRKLNEQNVELQKAIQEELRPKEMTDDELQKAIQEELRLTETKNNEGSEGESQATSKSE